MIKAVIFDVGNVILGFNHMKMCIAYAEFTVLPPCEINKRIFLSQTIREYEKGIITPHAFYEAAVAMINADKRLTFERFVRIWTDIFIPNQMIGTVLDRLHSEMVRIVLSNTNVLHWRYIADLPVMKKHFFDEKKSVLSFNQKCMKPDVRIFFEAIKRCCCTPQEIVYIDDVPAYVNVFRNLGGNGIVYNCQTESIDALTSALSAYSVLNNI